ncbi:MAG TPA: SAM-dependent methyltransferase [Gemmatimonadales bacterium]|nr:SAM-dependent methyltransferase [Gemmatimonadales bacterium]
MTINHISDTARWVALYRARESEREDALFHDPFARGLAGPEGEALVRRLEVRMRGDWPVVVRTRVMDEIILRLVRSGIRRVLNLAAGLDARPWRLPLPADLRWIDADLPAILDHKLRVLDGAPNRCYYRTARIDLSDDAERRTLFQQLGDGASETLVITEGLLVYLDPGTVASLARDLNAMPGCRWWLADVASPDLLAIAARQRRGRHDSLDVLQFAPADAVTWFAETGWKESEFRSSVHEGVRLGRAPQLEEFWEQLPESTTRSREERIRRFSGITLLEPLK